MTRWTSHCAASSTSEDAQSPSIGASRTPSTSAAFDCHRPSERLDVRQAAAAALQVRFEQRADVAGLRPTFDGRVAQPSQPPVGATVPEHERILLDLLRSHRIAEHAAHAEQCGGHVQIAVRTGQQRRAGVDRRAQRDPRIPQRTPQLVGDLVDHALGRHRRMDEHHVDIAERRHGTTTIRTGREE